MAVAALLGGLGLGVLLSWLVRPILARVAEKRRSTKNFSPANSNKITTMSQVLHLAIQGSPAGVGVITKKGDIILSNARAHDMGVVYDHTINEQVWAVAQEVCEDNEPRTLELHGTSKKTGSRVLSVKAHVMPLTLVDDRFLLIYCFDESEQVRMEAARRDFVANVSHELKTPVGGMALLAEALMESADDPDHVRYFGEKLSKEAHRLAGMINELISLSKLQGAEALPDLEEVVVDDVIDAAIERNQVAGDNADIVLTRDEPTGVSVHGDFQLLVTAVSNLVSNAINYSPSGTTVSVTQSLEPQPVSDARHDEGDQPLAVDAAPTVSIRVTDRGIGIAPEDQRRVFERFFRVDKARSRQTGGTGLGLAIVKHVAANHGGQISVWSRVGTGSTFTLRLPMATPAPAALPPPVLDPVVVDTAVDGGHAAILRSKIGAMRQKKNVPPGTS